MIRALDPIADRPAVADLLLRAADYYLLWQGKPPGPAAIDDFFTGCPPGCDPAASHRLGLWQDGVLMGLTEQSFGFPHPTAAYLGYMVLAPAARSQGLGARFLTHVEGMARQQGATEIFLAVLEVNHRGRAFWERQGFRPTGIGGVDDDHGLARVLHRLGKPL